MSKLPPPDKAVQHIRQRITEHVGDDVLAKHVCVCSGVICVFNVRHTVVG
jgi:hypothetical protein